jgi:hypothetical protein
MACRKLTVIATLVIIVFLWFSGQVQVCSGETKVDKETRGIILPGLQRSAFQL